MALYIPRIVPKIKAMDIALRARIKVFGKASEMICETEVPFLTKDVLR